MQRLESKIRHSASEKNRNDETLKTASNWGSLWDSHEIEYIKRNAGKMRPEEMATDLGRSYYGLQKKSENLGISLEIQHNGSQHQTSLQIHIKHAVKIHKVEFVPVMRNGVVIRYRRRERTYYEYEEVN